MDFSACNPNKSAPVITPVTTNQHVKIMWLRGSRPYPFAFMPIAQSSINRPPPLRKRGILIPTLPPKGKRSRDINLKMYARTQDSCNFCNLKIIVKLILLPVVFLD